MKILTEWAIGAGIIALLLVPVVLGIWFSMWAIVGGGAVCFAFYLWARLETGVWVDSFSDLTFDLFDQRR